MDLDHSVELATQLADQLIGVDRTEWKKWTEYLQRVGNLDRALLLAQQLGQKQMLRPGPQEAYRKIGEVIKRHKSTLAKLPMTDLYQVLGFVRWRLIGRLGTPLEGRLKTADTGKVQRGVKRVSDRERKRAR